MKKVVDFLWQIWVKQPSSSLRLMFEKLILVVQVEALSTTWKTQQKAKD